MCGIWPYNPQQPNLLVPWFSCSLVSNGGSYADKRTVIPEKHGRGEVLCVFQVDNSFPVNNSEIIMFWSYSETSLDWGFIYALQSKNNQMLDFQIVPRFPPGKKLHFM